MSNTISINRAPVLTLWAAVVAERLGFQRDEALTLGRSVAGRTAQEKGRTLGIFKPHQEKADKARKKEAGETFRIELLGSVVPAMNTEEGIRATIKGKPISPASVERYLEGKFGDDLVRVRKVMEKLARALDPEVLADAAYRLYERFRPDIPRGVKGWGAKGELDLGLLEAQAEKG
jgi:hypothetical protein